MDVYEKASSKSTVNVHITNLNLKSYSGAGLSFDAKSGGISNILVDSLNIKDTLIGVAFSTSETDNGGYIENILISDMELKNIVTAISASSGTELNQDDNFALKEFPLISRITLKNIIGWNISIAGNFSGTNDYPINSICLSNISFSIISETTDPWICSNVSGYSDNVNPEPCHDLQILDSTASCFSLSVNNAFGVL